MGRTNGGWRRARRALLGVGVVGLMVAPLTVAHAGPFAGNGMCRGKEATIDMSSSSTGQTINGTSGDDVIIGTQFDDTIHGGGGNDTICAGAGDDTVFGGPGNDVIQGQAGNDTIYGQGGNDQLDGNEGNDRIFGNDGSDVLYGGAGNDLLNGGNQGSNGDVCYGHNPSQPPEGGDRFRNCEAGDGVSVAADSADSSDTGESA